MLAFGHLGITLGAALLARGIVTRKHPLAHEDVNLASDGSSTPQGPKFLSVPKNENSGLASFIKHIDIRLLLVGSLLPDIIDKPVGQIIFRESISNGRIYCHTLLFLLLITIGGLIIFRYRHRQWLLILALGTFSHHILDGMWLQPGTFYWPIFGLTFPKLYYGSFLNFLNYLFQSLLANPQTYISETIGLIICAVFALSLIKRKSLSSLIRSGRIPD